MKILNIIIFCFLFCILINCTDPRSEREKTRDRLLIQLAQQMRKKELYAIGAGGGCNRDKKINLISIPFNYYDVLDIENARELIVESAISFLELITSASDSKNYFEKFPVPVEVIDIGIISQTNEKYNSSHIIVADLLNGKVHYQIDRLPPKDSPFLTVHEESFEEAESIVAQKKLCGSQKSHPHD